MGKDQLPVAIKARMRPATMQEEIKRKTERDEEELQMNVRAGDRARDSRKKERSRIAHL